MKTPKNHDYKPLLADDPSQAPPCAVLTLRGASDWSEDGRHMIAHWLREYARELLKGDNQYAPVFRARYMAVKP